MWDTCHPLDLLGLKGIIKLVIHSLSYVNDVREFSVLYSNEVAQNQLHFRWFERNLLFLERII